MTLQHEMPVDTEADIYIALAAIRRQLRERHFCDIDQQKVLVSVSELTRNVLDHTASGGKVRWTVLSDSITISVIDSGKGIANYEEIISGQTKATRAKGLGIGLSGTKRLMDEFSIQTSEGGTTIVVLKRRSNH